MVKEDKLLALLYNIYDERICECIAFGSAVYPDIGYVTVELNFCPQLYDKLSNY